MHVYIDEGVRAVDEEAYCRKPPAHQEIGIGAANGTGNQLIAHRAAIDEHELQAGLGAMIGGQACQAPQPECIPAALEVDHIGENLIAEHTRDATSPAAVAFGLARKIDKDTLVRGEAHADMRGGQRQAAHNIGSFSRFGAWRLQEFEPSRHGEKEITNLNDRAVDPRCRGRRTRAPACHLYPPGVLGRARARGQHQAAHSANRGQRLSAEAQCPDIDQIVIEEFRGCMALDCESKLVLFHPLAVVADADEAPPAVTEGDINLSRAGIDRVLNQFLDDARGALDHLASGDAVGNALRKSANPHGQVYRARCQSAISPISSTNARTVPDSNRAEG